MRRFISAVLSVVFLAAMAAAALAQADARRAYQAAQEAFQAGDFAHARTLAEKASKTDTNNPEVFLLLGKAHYQLGELDEAIAAWKRTLALAPQEPFAKQMLDALRARVTDVDTRIKLIEALIQQQLFAPALQECTKVLNDKALLEAQRAKVKLLQAESFVRMGSYPEALRVLNELPVYHPQEADAVQVALLSGRAKLHSGGDAVGEGVQLLKKLLADHPDTPAATVAEYELLAFDLRQGITSPRVEAMGRWLAANQDHELADEGRRGLLDAYLALARLGPQPTAESDLDPADVKALALAAQMRIHGQFQPADKADALCRQLLDHWEARYTNHGAHAAAVRAMETLLAEPLPRSARLAVLKALASSKYLIAAEWLDEMAEAGQLPAGVPRGKLPEKLTDVLAVFQTIRSEYPAEPFWIDQANLAKRVRASAPRVLPTAEFRGLKGPDAWALDIAMPVIAADGDAAAVTSAADTVLGIINEQAALPKPESRKLAVELSVELLDAMAETHASWPKVINSYYTVATDYASYVFQENIKAGRAAENAKLSENQKQFLATLKDHVASHAAHAPHALVQLATHVGPWVEHGHWAVAEEAYTTVKDALPENQRRQADLAIVRLWVQQVTRRHSRLTAAGFTVPRQLDPTLVKALKRCRELQAGLEEEPATLAEVRGVWDSVIQHYKSLQYYDVAEEAVNVKPDEAVDAADEYAAFNLARLKDEHARRQLARLLMQYGGSDQIALGPEFQAAIAGWKKFITDRPDSPLASTAAESIVAIARLFEEHAAHLVAAEVHADLAQFAAGIDVLSQSLPGKASVVERAAFARATALDAQARKMLAKQTADRKSDDPPPAKLSEEFVAAIAAYSGFIADHPESSLVSNATSKIMAVASEYANIDAWDVADGVFADLLASKLDIRRPERLKFARGVCQLGRAMPDHAREVLSTLTSTGLRGSGIATDPAMLAGTYSSTMPAGGVGGGGIRGDARPGASMPTTRPPVAELQPADDAAPEEGPPPARIAAGGIADMPMNINGSDSFQPSDEANRDAHLLAMINQQEAQRASQVAQMRENITFYQTEVQQDGEQAARGQQMARQVPAAPVISEAELARQAKAITAAYDIFQAIRKDHPDTPTAEQARGEILVMVGHWRGLTQWQLSAELAQRFLDDNPTDRDRPKLSLEVARDWLAWAAKPIERKATRQEMLKRVSERFDTARAKLAGVVADFPKEKSCQQQAQWDIAKSFLTQARVIAAFSPTLARGQYVRTARELRRVAEEHSDHPQIAAIPQMLWDIAAELEGRGFDDEAIVVWNELSIHDPMHALSQQAAMKIAQTYHQKLKRPLRAAQAYQELNFARGGNDQGMQNAIFQIGSELKGQKRYVEALHVLETFVDSFPRHAQAGQALTMVGQIHQTNEAWEDAIAAYRRVIDEYENGQFRQDAKWAIAECTINLSQWREAAEAYREYVAAYSQDAKVAEANRRIEVLKDLVRYQGLVDQEGQRKAFDAQFQIATIVRDQLANPVKAIIEFRKVVATWPQSHLADDALYAIGTAYLALEETDKAREALLQVAEKYPASPLADDALYAVGKSYEDEATKLATVTRETTLARNKEEAQRRAYRLARDNLFRQQESRSKRIASLKEMGKGASAEFEEALKAGNFGQFNDANVKLFAQKAEQEVESLTATQLADRQDKINAALRKAVEAYTSASKVAGADKADEALLQMATIYDQRLKDSGAAMATWQEIVRQFSGTSVAEDASWRIAQHYEREQKYAEAVRAYEAFLRSYRGGERAGAAQFAIAENYEHLGEWVKAMDAYTNYVTNYPSGPLVAKAKEQITWIKTYWL